MTDAATTESSKPAPVPCEGKPTRGWYAWNNRMPIGPGSFHTIGEVEVGNPGIIAILAPKIPQGMNPTILLLDLHLRQRPGMWPQVVTWATARYDSDIPDPPYTHVQVFCEEQEITNVPVENIS